MHHKIVIALSVIIGLEACLVILGWVFGVDWLTRMIPAGINMKFPTAVTFLVSALGLYYISQTARSDHDTSQVILPGISLFIFSFISALFVSAAFGVETGLDSPFTQETSSVYAAGSGMPSLPTMINFILFGVACMVSLFPGRWRGKSIAVFGGLISLAGLSGVMGYALQAPLLYYQFNGPFVPIAFNTALMFVLLGSGLIGCSAAKKQ